VATGGKQSKKEELRIKKFSGGKQSKKEELRSSNRNSYVQKMEEERRSKMEMKDPPAHKATARPGE
jgi:hypothetical protein